MTENSCILFLMIRRPPRSTLSPSSAASDVYKRQDLTVFCDNKNGQIVLNCTVMRFSITPLIGYRGFKCKIIINNKVDIEKFIDVMMKDFEEFRNIIDEYAEQNDELSNSLDKKSDLEKNTTDTAVNIVGDVLDILGDIIKIIDENK